MLMQLLLIIKKFKIIILQHKFLLKKDHWHFYQFQKINFLVYSVKGEKNIRLQKIN